MKKYIIFIVELILFSSCNFDDIKTNVLLNNFCGLESLAISNTNLNLLTLEVLDNAFNTTLEQLVDGVCSQ